MTRIRYDPRHFDYGAYAHLDDPAHGDMHQAQYIILYYIIITRCIILYYIILYYIILYFVVSLMPTSTTRLTATCTRCFILCYIIITRCVILYYIILYYIILYYIIFCCIANAHLDDPAHGDMQYIQVHCINL